MTENDFLEASVHLANGDVYKGDLALGTDGENSQCHELMLARPDPPCHYGDMNFGLDVKQVDIRKHGGLQDIVDPPPMRQLLARFWNSLCGLPTEGKRVVPHYRRSARSGHKQNPGSPAARQHARA